MNRFAPILAGQRAYSASRYLALCDAADAKAAPDRTPEQRAADYALAAERSLITAPHPFLQPAKETP